MDEHSVANIFSNVSTPNLSAEQKREVAKLLAEYLNSYEFALHIKAVLARY